MIVIAKDTAFKLSSNDGLNVEKTEIHELKSNQEETDSRVIVYSLFGAERGYGAVRVRSPDSDIFFILLHHAQKIKSEIFFDTGVGNKRRLLNISTISKEFGDKFSTALLGLHAFT